MRDLIARAASVSDTAALKYAGDFERYWRAANLHGQREGLALEAVFAWRGNRYLRGTSEFVVTSVEGFPTHRADIIERAMDGTELARYQVKLELNLNSASRHLSDYEGMRLLTTRESYQRVLRELEQREASALRRGVPLAEPYQRARMPF